MNLEKYLEMREISISQFSNESGIPYATIYSYLAKRRTPTLEMAYIISKCTGGIVKPFSLLQDHVIKELDDRIKMVSK